MAEGTLVVVVPVVVDGTVFSPLAGCVGAGPTIGVVTTNDGGLALPALSVAPPDGARVATRAAEVTPDKVTWFSVPDIFSEWVVE